MRTISRSPSPPSCTSIPQLHSHRMHALVFQSDMTAFPLAVAGYTTIVIRFQNATFRKSNRGPRRYAESGGPKSPAQWLLAQGSGKFTLAPDRLPADQHLADHTFGAADQLFVIEQFAKNKLAGGVVIPLAQGLRIDHQNVRLGTDLEGADIEPEKCCRLAGQAPDHGAHRIQRVLLGELERHQVAVKKG